MKRRLRKILAVLLIIAIVFNTVDVSAFAADATTLNQSELAQNEWDGTTTQTSFQGENYVVTFSLAGYWNGGYNANIRIQNTGDSTIENWYVGYESANEITNIWNAEIHSNESVQYIIKNAGWNQDIPVGGYVEFGFSGKEDFKGFPKEYTLLGQIVELEKNDYTIEYKVDSDWGSGFVGTIFITNNTDETIEDWSVDFCYDRQIVNLWNAYVESCEGNQYIIKNAGYNSNIKPGETISLGFTGKDGVKENVPFAYKLHAYKLDGIEYVDLADGKIDKRYLERAIYTNLLLKNMSIDNVRLSDDYDGDGLSLAQEYEYDTNPFLVDTDEDGLTDYEEIYTYRTSAIKFDTDEDGMSDGTEVDCGLNPLNVDTDGDGIRDNNEVVTQNVRIDTIQKFDLQKVGTLPSIEITGKGDYSQRMYASAIENDATILDINCLVGTPFDFVHDDDLSFEKSKLTFTVSDEVLKNNELENLAIAWYNEEENSLELLDTTYNAVDKTISANVEHYSIYMVVSILSYLIDIDWKNESSIIESGKADVVFAIDTTGSMEDEIQNVKNNIGTLVSQLEKNKVDVRLGLVEYKDIVLDGANTTKNYGWYTDVSAFKNKLSTLSVIGGGGDGPESAVDALCCAGNMKYRTGVKKYIILITDANYKNGTTQTSDATLSSETGKLVDKGIVTSVVTPSEYYSLYNETAIKTNGVIANINQDFATALIPLVNKMSEQVNEKCWVRLSNGSIVSLDKDPTLGDDSVDTDGDGVPDVIELKSSHKVFVYNPYIKTKQWINTWSFYSNPVKKDTDGDNISDVDDLQPTIYDIAVQEKTEEYIKFNTGRKWNIIKCTSFDYLDNLMQMVDGNVNNPIQPEDFRQIVQNVDNNASQSFTLWELAYIGVTDNEGSKLYMQDVSSATREVVFQLLSTRESRYYRHSGIWWMQKWSEVPKGTASGFWTGAVLSEADINFSCEIYYICDVFSALELLADIGVIVIVVIVTIKATPVIAANIEALTYYVKTYGVSKGMQMYTYLGVKYVPDGVITWIQLDMADGDSSLDDMLPASIPIHERGDKGQKILEKMHPGESQYSFDTYVNGIKGRRVIDRLSNNIAYESKVGYTCLSQRVKMQVLKDAYLLNNKEVEKVVWAFFKSDVTGRVGASKQLIMFLEQHGIEYVIYYDS